ncbi:gtpase domain-containing protein [Stemphylium lycopersici]|nr:gtpase domain-containing protein [Stemphylium lycopersici]RAR00903.1 gtpase domain-containing protein [Stemphylium lycopersici]
MNGLQQHMPESTQSPLFEPERPDSSVAIEAIVPSSSPRFRQSSSPESSAVSPHIAQLQSIESATKAAIASWNHGVLSMLPAKRKALEILSDSEDEDSDNEQDPAEVAPYDPTQQRRPKLPIYHPGFQQAEEDAQKILRVFMDFLKVAKNRGVGGEEATYLWNQIIDNRDILYQDEIRIAVTGDTGSGKSATTNALLGEDLTPEGDSGGACTNVVTEFRQKRLSTNIGAVQAEVQLYCLEYCTDDLVTNWFKVWFTTRQKMMQDEDSVDDDDRARKDAALECLEHIFTPRVAPDSLEDFMASSKSLENNPALKKLLQWTVEIHEQFVPDGELSVCFKASTHNDMREQLRPFRMRAQNARFNGKLLSFSPWPFVEIIRYYVDSPLLQDGICLADVPGAKDINMYRVTAANAYLQQCEMTIVVVDIKRATSDQSFRQHYLDAHSRRHHGSVILVATRSDEMNDDGGSTLQLDTMAADQLAPIEEKLGDLIGETQLIDNETEAKKHEIKRIKLMIQRGNATEDDCDSAEALRTANKKASARKKAIASSITLLEKERKEVRIVCRNRFVATGMNRMYTSSTGDDAGAASFCLSNRMYMRHRRGYNALNPDKAPTMKLEDTQIPAACTYISGIPSQGKIAVLEHFILFKIPMLLSIVQMSCSKSTEARVEHVTKIMDEAIKDVEFKVEMMATKCRATFLKDLCSELLSRELLEKFDRNAEKKLEILANLNAASHRALVNKKGLYHQKKLGIKHDLNGALLSPAKPAMENAFRTVIDIAPAAFKAQAAQAIKSGFNELNRKLKDDPQALAGDAYQMCFGKNLVGYEKDITLKVDAASKSLRQGLIAIHQKAIKTTESGYIYEAMDDIYTKAGLEKQGNGQRLKDVRHAYLEENIPVPDGPFSAIGEWTEEDATKLINVICEKLCGEVVKILKTIRAAFQRQKHRKENDTPEGQQFRKELHGLVAEASRILDGVVRESLEKCKEYK